MVEFGAPYALLLTTNPKLQLNVRVPSMLIRRDGLMASPYPMAHNFEKLLSARTAPPTAGRTLSPIQQQEVIHIGHVENQKAQALNKALGTPGQIDE